MRKKVMIRIPILLIFLSSIQLTAYSQVTIGSGIEPKSGALLDLKENDNLGTNATKGLGMPRVLLTHVDTLTVAHASQKEIHIGVAVYNINPAMKNGAGEGFYVWDGTKWNPTVVSLLSPWYGVDSKRPAFINIEDSYLNAKAVIGGSTIRNDATLTVTGSADISTTLNVAGISTLMRDVGIGTAAPTRKLDVRGTAYISDSLGIGTAKPVSKLDVAGDISSKSHISVGYNNDVATGYGSMLNLQGIFNNTDPVWMAKYNVAQDKTELRVNVSDNPTHNDDRFSIGTTVGGTWTPFFVASAAGRAGINTDILTETLNINGNSHTSGNSYTIGNMGIGTNKPSKKLDVVGDANISTTLNVGGVSTLMGNVGIGTATPSRKLDVVGNANISTTLNVAGNTSLMANVGIGVATPTKKLDVRGDTYISGNVGIGTTAPASKLDVNGNIRSAKEISVGNETTVTTGYGSQLFLRGIHNNTDEVWMAKFNVANDQTELRVNLSDDQNLNDRFAVGSTPYQTKIWAPVFLVSASGRVGINTVKLTDDLTVKGKIRAVDFIKDANAGADFVFDDDYALPSLTEVETFIKANRHLPEIPSEREMIENGINIGELQIKLLQKIEELTLYIIEQDKLISEQQQRIEKLESSIAGK